METILEMIKEIRAIQNSLKVSVKIDYEEVLKIVIKDLIKKRNSPGNKIVKSFDDVLCYYLGEKDFEKYVLNNEQIEE